MSKGSERRAARRAARQERQKERQANRLARQENRQGFLSNMVGEGGLSGLVSTAGEAFGGGKDDAMSDMSSGTGGAKSGTGEGGEGSGTFDIKKFLPLIAIGAFLLLKKK